MLLYNYLFSLDNPWILEVVYKCLKNSTTIISSTFLFLSTNHDSLHIYKKKPSKYKNIKVPTTHWLPLISIFLTLARRKINFFMQNIRGNIMHRITHPQGVPLCIFVSKSLKIETRRKLPTRYWLLLKSVFLTLVGQKCYFECKIFTFHISNVKWPLMFFFA